MLQEKSEALVYGYTLAAVRYVNIKLSGQNFKNVS